MNMLYVDTSTPTSTCPPEFSQSMSHVYVRVCDRLQIRLDLILLGWNGDTET